MGWQDPYVGWADRLALAALFVSILLLANYLQQRRYSKFRGCLSSCRQAPVKDPFIGLDFVYERLFRGTPERGLQTCCQNFAQLGATYTVKRWTSQAIHTCDSRNIRHILATGFEDFELPKVRVSVLQDLLGTGIFTLDGPSWSRARGLLRPALMKQKMDALPAILEFHVEALLGRIPRDGTRFDLQPLFFGFTMDVATAFFMGQSTCMLGGTGVDKAQQFVADYMLCSEEATKKMRLGPLSGFRFNSAAQRAKKRVFQYVDEYIDRSLLLPRDEEDDDDDDDKNNNGRRNAGGNLMQVLAASVDNRKALRDQVLHILLASRDTTASLLSNLFFMLAKRPGIYAKLREELLDGAVGRGIPTPDQLKDMRYLRWCVNESLRLHPVIPSNARQASRDTTLPRGGGPDGDSPLFVRRGTVVLYNIYAMQRDDGVFGAEPEDFVPERWDGLRPGWNYLPFNGGPRVCIGQQFALLETYYVVVRLVQTFSALESCDDGEWMELPALATTCKNGVYVRTRI